MDIDGLGRYRVIALRAHGPGEGPRFQFAAHRDAERAHHADDVVRHHPVGHLQPGISPAYGFTAIIVAFLDRLNPVGILIAGLFLALTFIGGEQAQIAMKIPLDVTKVFQGILLFYVLACDSLILYRFRLISSSPRVSSGIG